MNILMTGSGRSGSWLIRGEQLGPAIGAKVQSRAIDIAAFDAAVVVKRPTPDLVQRIHRAGVPLIWDIVDAWPQPEGNRWDRVECMAWLRGKVAELKPAAIVAATHCMACDCEEFGVPVLWLPHHARPGLERNPIREKVRKVGYEGGNYLGAWRQVLESECSKRGWSFEVNPPSLSELDIVVAMREVDGYAPQNWKSNVKLANAQGSGTPCVLNSEAGYHETQCFAEQWADGPEELSRAFDSLTTHEARKNAGAKLFEAAPRLEKIAKDYRAWLEKVCSQSC